MQTILVTGASGFVGSRFVKRWNNEYRILAPSHSEMDITDAASVDSYMRVHRPDAVLHLAAISNTGYCEHHPEESYSVNVRGAENVARAATQCGAKFIFFSSDQIYNGNIESGLLREDIAVSPENVYGKHKLEAEQRIAVISSDAVMLRATWMYDAHCEGLPKHNDFVHNIAAAMEQHTTLAVPVREYRGITWVREAVEFLPLTFSLQGGVYNYGAENSMNTYETACCYCEMSGVGGASLQYITPDYERFSSHERNISISGDRLFRASGGRICFSNTIDGLRLFIEMTLSTRIY